MSKTADLIKRLRSAGLTQSEIARRTGIPHHLDHIIPLTHPRVCGLTVPWNLRIIPSGANCSKGNRWCPEQEELFPPLAGQGELFGE